MGERAGGLGFGRRTSVLAGDEIDVLVELDVEAGVAHEVLQPDAGDRPRRHRRRPRDAFSLLVGRSLHPKEWVVGDCGVLFGGQLERQLFAGKKPAKTPRK